MPTVRRRREDAATSVPEPGTSNAPTKEAADATNEVSVVLPAWVRCELCEDYWCRIHQDHVYDCPCPPIEDWPIDPYVESHVLAK